MIHPDACATARAAGHRRLITDQSRGVGDVRALDRAASLTPPA